jgi:hypothetical protein
MAHSAKSAFQEKNSTGLSPAEWRARRQARRARKREAQPTRYKVTSELRIRPPRPPSQRELRAARKSELIALALSLPTEIDADDLADDPALACLLE